MLTPRQLYDAGQIADAIAAMNAEVKKNPGDVQRRGFLCELLSFAGNFDRADLQLDTIGTQDPEAILGVSLWRQLLRAELARQQFYTDGRLPEFLDKPTASMQSQLEASIHLREGQPDKALELLTQAEEQRVKPSGTCDGEAFDDFRDLDDLNTSCFEVLTSNGKYYWIPIERVELVEFHKPERPRDLLWLRVHMIVKDGPDGEVFLPTIYPATYKQEDERLKLGRATDWLANDGEPVRGVGLRTYLVGENDKTILEMSTLEFA